SDLLTAINGDKQLFFDCATGVSLTFQIAAFQVAGPRRFNMLLPNLTVLSALGIDPISTQPGGSPEGYLKLLKEMEDAVAQKKPPKRVSDLIPGDMRTFYNPKGKPPFLRENTIYIGDGEYFAWGFADKSIFKKRDLIVRLTGLTGQTADEAQELEISTRPT